MNSRHRNRNVKNTSHEGRNFNGPHGGFEGRLRNNDDYNFYNPNEHVWPNNGWERGAQFDTSIGREYDQHGTRGFGMDTYNTRADDDGFSHAGQDLQSRA